MAQVAGTNMARAEKTGRFVGHRTLTDMQMAFVRAYVRNGCNGSAAARTAGYERHRHDKTAGELLHNPRVIEAIAREQVKAAIASGSVALGTLVEICGNPDAPPTARVAAANSLLRVSGLLQSEPVGSLDEAPDEEAPKAIRSYAAVFSKLRDLVQVEEDGGNIVDLTPVEFGGDRDR